VKLSIAITAFIEHKRTTGQAYASAETQLISFSKFLRNPDLGKINHRKVAEFLNRQPTLNSTWMSKYGRLKQFFDYWSARQEIVPIVMPPPRRRERTAFIPHIYSRPEIKALLSKTRLCQLKSHTVEARTVRTLIIFLYATGARFGETLSLKRSDVDLKAGTVKFPGTRLSRRRCIPIAPDLIVLLRGYLKSTSGRMDGDATLFVRKDGRPLVMMTIQTIFKNLRRLAGIHRKDTSVYMPRLHDLRSTFAVHRITAWIKEGCDLNRMLPALSAYLGQAGLISTERYLSLTPERYRKELNKLSPKKSKTKWRNDPSLMNFLEKL
jgi:integrase/recombinase XerD